MSTKLLIELNRDQQIEIENICVEQNKSFTEYFMGLHEKNKLKKAVEVKEIEIEKNDDKQIIETKSKKKVKV